MNQLLSRFFSQKVILGLALLVLLSVCVYPFLNLFYKILFPDGVLSFQYLEAVLQSPSTAKATRNTLFVAFAVSALSIVIALPLGWILTRTNLPMASKFRSWFCLPYAIPPYIGAIAWIYLANPTTGMINQLVGFTLIDVYSYWGLIWVESTFLYTFVLLTVLTSLDRMDSSLEEAARLSGASPVKVFFDITLPLIKAPLVSGGVLVALASAASFGVPALIGSPARIYLMTTQIYTYQKMGSMSGIYKAGALSMTLLFMAVGLLILNHFFIRKSQFQTVSGKTSRPSLIDLGPWKNPIVIFFSLLLFLLFILPITGILITALSSVQGKFGLDNLTLNNFYRIFFEMSETGRAIGNSFYLGITAATAATFLGLLLAYIQWKTKLPGRHWLDIIASFPYSTPGTVVALALILAFSGGFFGIGPSLYNTLGMLWLAYMIKYLSFSVKTIGDGYGQIDDCLAEAARVSGASWWTTMKTIWLPLMKPSIVAAWFLIFMPAFSELTMTIMLTGPGIETIGTVLFQLQEYADVSGGGSAVLALLVVFCVVLVNFSVKKLSNGKYGL